MFTYAEYALIPPDGKRHELIEGEFFVTPAPSSFHQTVSRRLQHELMTQLEDRGLAFIFNAPTDVILGDHDVVQPDLAIVRASRKSIITERGIEGPPDIVVEILSPSTRLVDQHLKRKTYAKYEVPEYWIVDPDHAWIWIYRLVDGEYRELARYDRASALGHHEFGGVMINREDIFRPL